jgi:hypothetical protein
VASLNLCEIVILTVSSAIISQQNAQWNKLYKDCAKDNIDFLGIVMPTAHQKFTDITPLAGHLFDDHPQPSNGLVAYGCVFSNHF